MRRRGTGAGVRDALATEYRRMADLYGAADERLGQLADRIEAGEAVEVHGYEVGLPGVDRVLVEADGAVVPVDQGRVVLDR